VFNDEADEIPLTPPVEFDKTQAIHGIEYILHMKK
jgi:hypothetical protein